VDKISWKYALGLDLDDEGFDPSVLSEFRTRVVAHSLEQRVLDLLLDALKVEGLERVPRILRAGCGRPGGCCIDTI